MRAGDFPPFPRINKRKGKFEFQQREENHFSRSGYSVLNDLSFRALRRDHKARLGMTEAERELDDFRANAGKQ